MIDHGYICDPDKHTDCPKTLCWRNGGLCKMTRRYEYATDEEQEKYKDEKRDNG